MLNCDVVLLLPCGVCFDCLWHVLGTVLSSGWRFLFAADLG